MPSPLCSVHLTGDDWRDGVFMQPLISLTSNSVNKANNKETNWSDVDQSSWLLSALSSLPCNESNSDGSRNEMSIHFNI